MQYIWEFFEGMDEMVYVTDLETDQLIYINAYLREQLGYTSHEEYCGKKCFEVLQGRSVPCEFCTNSQLEPGKFVSWTHKNPILNKRMLVKDTIILYEDRRYRIEFAIDLDGNRTPNSSYYYARNETILNKCLQRMFSTMDPEESIENLLVYLGETFSSDRSYIFEIEDDLMSNTYEWCMDGVLPQTENLQRDSIELVDWWIEEFRENKVVVIEDLESIHKTHPLTYCILKPQNIQSLVVGPIMLEGQVLGFVGVDNPSVEMMPLITPLLNVVGYFVASLLKRRDLLKRLNRLSFHDALTGAYNRNAMFEHHIKNMNAQSMGVIYCDITGLKQMNDAMGHSAGDQMILHCYQLIQQAMSDTQWIYRTGGDEFVVIDQDSTRAEFMKRVENLREHIHQDKYHIAIGYAWSAQKPLSIEPLIAEADMMMYEDKRTYYEKRYLDTKISRGDSSGHLTGEYEYAQSPFCQFLRNTYHDVEVIFQSISQDNDTSYFYFGDMQKDLFYISDSLRNEFSFESNIVPNLLQEWALRISTPKFREMYEEEMQSILRDKRTVHDLRYQVQNASGKNMWIRCYGIIKWDQDQTKPLFFSGRITHQDNDFVVDPITNFPRGSVSYRALEQLESSGEKTIVIGFGLNHISEINSTRGRPYTDRLLRNIADELTGKLLDKMAFYRLEGVRYIALVEPEFASEGEELVQRIHDIIEGCYQAMDISIHSTCTFSMVQYPQEGLSSEDLLEHIVSLLKVAKYEVTKPYMDDSINNINQVKQVSKMSLALNEAVMNNMENFRVVIQPVVSAQTGQVIGGEVLLRWTFEGENVSPALFIPMLEQSDMINVVGRWVFEQAVRNCVRLIPFIPDFYLTFNVSLRQLTDIQFTDVMRRTLERFHLDGSHLVAEITESCLDEQPENLMKFIQTCRSMGLRIALDDFGSGYSSLQMLLRYPYNLIKLDRSLLQEMTASDQKWQFIRSIVYACHQFGKKVCMEGVETKEQSEIIKQAGCDIIQGFFYYRPMEVCDLYHMLSET